MNYRQIVFKLPALSTSKRNQKSGGGAIQSGVNKENTVDYSIDINESGDIIDVINDQDEEGVLKKASSTSGNSSMFQRKRVTPNTENHRKQQSAKVQKGQKSGQKQAAHKSIDEIDDIDDQINDRIDDLNIP